jgi:hypothetical protein
MTRKTYIQIDGKLVDKDEYYAGRIDSHGMTIITDGHYDGLRAPDGTDISTRSKHQAYMKRTGLTTTDDFKSQWSQQAEARAKYVQQGGSISRSDIQRAIAKLQRG